MPQLSRIVTKSAPASAPTSYAVARLLVISGFLQVDITLSELLLLFHFAHDFLRYRYHFNIDNPPRTFLDSLGMPAELVSLFYLLTNV
jgi:hypothetical protein